MSCRATPRAVTWYTPSGGKTERGARGITRRYRAITLRASSLQALSNRDMYRGLSLGHVRFSDARPTSSQQ
jgi:hypothetical protein